MKITTSFPRTIDEVREWFFQEGLSVAGWSRANGFRPEAIYALLAGRTRGSRGQAHRAAVALGLKRGPGAHPVRQKTPPFKGEEAVQ